MTRTQLSFDREMLRQARKRAQEGGISLAEYVRRLVAEDLGDRPAATDPSAIFDLGSSTASDVSQHKDAMLAEALSLKIR